VDLVLIRHPAVAVEAGVCYGSSDVPVAGDAAQEAAVLARRLEALGVPAPARIVSSPLARCAHIAQVLAGQHAVTLREDARLAEMDFGAWELQRWDAIERVQIDAWAADFDHARPHGGESVAQFEARVRAWFDACVDERVASFATPERAACHVVTHAGVMRVIASFALRVPLEQCLKWTLDMAGIVWLRRDAVSGEWALVRWNV
jgi:alpha-ribazole phosphatase